MTRLSTRSVPARRRVTSPPKEPARVLFPLTNNCGNCGAAEPIAGEYDLRCLKQGKKKVSPENYCVMNPTPKGGGL